MTETEEKYIQIVNKRVEEWDRENVDELEALLHRYEAHGFCIYELEALKNVQGSDWGNHVLAVDDSYRVLTSNV